MSALGNFIERALSSLKTDRDVPVGVSDPGDSRGALHMILKDSQASKFTPPNNADTITTTNTDNVQVIKYYSGGIAGVLLKTITITSVDCDTKIEVT